MHNFNCCALYIAANNKTNTLCKVPDIFFPDFKQIWIFSISFPKISQYQISLESFQSESRALILADRRTDRRGEADRWISRRYQSV